MPCPTEEEVLVDFHLLLPLFYRMPGLDLVDMGSAKLASILTLVIKMELHNKGKTKGATVWD